MEAWKSQEIWSEDNPRNCNFGELSHFIWEEENRFTDVFSNKFANLIFVNFFWKIVIYKILIQQTNQKKNSKNVPVLMQNRPSKTTTLLQKRLSQKYDFCVGKLIKKWGRELVER